MGAGLVHEGVVEEGVDPVRVAAAQVVDLRLVAAAHHQQVADTGLIQVLAGLGRGLVREDVDEALV